MSRPVVVVVSRPGAAADSLREALQHAGAQLAWIGEPEQLDPQSPPGEVVVVNLDPAIEPDLARLAPLWDSETVRVVFNDATVTEGLSGWDLKRWARHLVAKVFAQGGHPELPERPAGAEPVPVAIAEDGSAAGEDVPIALRIPGRRYVEDEISEEMGAPPLPYDAAEEAASSSVAPACEGAEVQTDASARKVAPAATDPPLPDEPSAPPETPLEVEAGALASGAEEIVFTDDLDLIAGGGVSSELPPIAIDPDAELDVTPPPQEDELEKLLRRAREQTEAPAAAPPPSGRAPAAKPTELKLAEDAQPTPAAPEGDSGEGRKAVDWSRFRIDSLSLAPLEDERPVGDDSSAAEPTPPSVRAAPSPTASASATTPAAGAVDPQARPAAQLWLLIGSFGASEGIAQFLAQLRASRRATLLVAVSGGDGPAPLSSMLAKRAGRAVPVLGTQATPLVAGDLRVLPEGFRFGSSTRSELRPERGAPGSAWLDALLREAVALFEHDCGVIVFSGGSREGFEGTLAVAQRGGAVWAQDPATCIAPDLPELVRSRGLAVFVGSPRALAEHFNQEIG